MSAGHVWWPGLVGSGITAVTFLAIAGLLGTALSRRGQWRANPLAVGTFLIFLSCGGGHLIHTMQLLYPWMGGDLAIATAARVHYAGWHLWAADGLTALAGVAYLLLRGRFSGMVAGAAMFEDLRLKQSMALALHDGIVQRLVAAQWRLDLEEVEEARATIAAARQELARPEGG